MHLRGGKNGAVRRKGEREGRERKREGDREVGKGLFHDHHGNEGAPWYLEVMSE